MWVRRFTPDDRSLSLVSCHLSLFNNSSGHAFRRAVRDVLRAAASQATEERFDAVILSEAKDPCI